MAHRVLIVDDDAELRELLARAFERAGFVAETAGDGREGLAAALSRSPDVVITDLVMPGQDGLDLIAELLLRDPMAKIIAISGGGSPNGCHLTAARALGAQATLRKPFMPGEVVVAARRLLEAERGKADFVLVDDRGSPPR